MKIFEILMIAVGLAMDAFAVSVTSGFTERDMKKRTAVKIAVFFGVFQAVMPLIGWMLGGQFIHYFESYDHWIAFVILAFIGGKMIYEGMIIEKCEIDKECMTNKKLCYLSVATSIDAFAVGLTLSVLQVSIMCPVIVIGVVTFLLSLLGVYLGKKLGGYIEKKMEIIGGIILILIGLKIVIEHLFFM